MAQLAWLERKDLESDVRPFGKQDLRRDGGGEKTSLRTIGEPGTGVGSTRSRGSSSMLTTSLSSRRQGSTTTSTRTRSIKRVPVPQYFATPPTRRVVRMPVRSSASAKKLINRGRPCKKKKDGSGPLLDHTPRFKVSKVVHGWEGECVSSFGPSWKSAASTKKSDVVSLVSSATFAPVPPLFSKPSQGDQDYAQASGTVVQHISSKIKTVEEEKAIGAPRSFEADAEGEGIESSSHSPSRTEMGDDSFDSTLSFTTCSSISASSNETIRSPLTNKNSYPLIQSQPPESPTKNTPISPYVTERRGSRARRTMSFDSLDVEDSP
ncbi:hypothetical protein T439DRAFT_325346 [Meredithblackwellia eburnea MCA 4105]